MLLADQADAVPLQLHKRATAIGWYDRLVHRLQKVWRHWRALKTPLQLLIRCCAVLQVTLVSQKRAVSFSQPKRRLRVSTANLEVSESARIEVYVMTDVVELPHSS